MTRSSDVSAPVHDRAIARFHAAFGDAGDAVLADPDGVVIAATGTLAALVAEVGRPLGGPMESCISSDLAAAVDAVRVGGSHAATADVAVAGDRRLRVRVFPVIADDGSPRYLLGTIVPESGGDELRRLRRTDRLYEMLFERAPSGVALVALDGTFIRANPAFCRLVGRPEAELLSMGFAQITHPDDLELDLSLVADVLAGRVDRYDIDKRYLRPDGSVVWAHLTVAMLRDDEGREEHFISMVEDITDRHAAAEQLRVAVDVLETTFRHSPVAMAELALDGTVLRANAAAGALIDCDPTELVGTSTVDLLDPTDRSDGVENLLRIAAGEVKWGYRERRIRDRHGKDRWLSVHTSAIFDREGVPERFVLQAVDISEARELRDKLEQSVEGLSLAFREKVGLMSALSHDLRAPLAAIRILAELLAEQDADGGRGDLAGRLRREAERTEAVLSDLVSSERAAAGLVVPRRVPVDLRKLVTRVVRARGDHERRTVLQLGAGDAVVSGDPALLERLVDNLMVNAARHTGPSATVWVGLLEAESEAGLVLRVEDDGEGVPDHFKQAIFEPFVRGHHTDRPGSGIGLFLVRQFAEYHGGRVVCLDRPGGGARFEVTLPIGAAGG